MRKAEMLKCPALHPGGMREISRGLSDSDTPGQFADGSHPGRGASDGRYFSRLAPLRGAEDMRRCSGGVASLNPRLIAFIPPGWETCCVMGDAFVAVVRNTQHATRNTIFKL